MRLHKITAVDPISNAPLACRFAASMAEARVRRNELMEKLELQKKFVHVVETNVLTQKPDLLAFINGLLEGYDRKDKL